MYLFDPAMRMLHKSKNDFFKTRTSFASDKYISCRQKIWHQQIAKVMQVYQDHIWTSFILKTCRIECKLPRF